MTYNSVEPLSVITDPMVFVIVVVVLIIAVVVLSEKEYSVANRDGDSQ